MITRDEFYARVDRLEDGINRRFDEVRDDHKTVVATVDAHDTRLIKLELAPPTKTTRWGAIGTGVGAAIYAVGHYVLTALSTKGDPR